MAIVSLSPRLSRKTNDDLTPSGPLPICRGIESIKAQKAMPEFRVDLITSREPSSPQTALGKKEKGGIKKHDLGREPGERANAFDGGLLLCPATPFAGAHE